MYSKTNKLKKSTRDEFKKRFSIKKSSSKKIALFIVVPVTNKTKPIWEGTFKVL